jgi:hypothetical protein
VSDLPVRTGGLFRCCVLSVAEYDGPEVPGETVIGCNYHKDTSEPAVQLARDGVWEWIDPGPSISDLSALR